MTTVGLTSQKWFQLEQVIYENGLSFIKLPCDKLIKSKHTLESIVKCMFQKISRPPPWREFYLETPTPWIFNWCKDNFSFLKSWQIVWQRPFQSPAQTGVSQLKSNRVAPVQEEHRLYVFSLSERLNNVEPQKMVDSKSIKVPRDRLLRPWFHSPLSRYQSSLMFRKT